MKRKAEIPVESRTYIVSGATEFFTPHHFLSVHFENEQATHTVDLRENTYRPKKGDRMELLVSPTGQTVKVLLNGKEVWKNPRFNEDLMELKISKR